MDFRTLLCPFLSEKWTSEPYFAHRWFGEGLPNVTLLIVPFGDELPNIGLPIAGSAKDFRTLLYSLLLSAMSFRTLLCPSPPQQSISERSEALR